MKTEISRDSHQPQKRYSGVYQQQGRMLTDADWNELVEILKDRLNDALKDVVGSKEGSIGGTPRHRALKVIKASNTDSLTIQPGYVHVDGYQAEAKPDPLKYRANQPLPEIFDYDKQLDFPLPPILPAVCVVYADVWERTVTHLMDERLRDKGLHGADTCTRKQMMAQVKWCPVNVDPEKAAENPTKGDAELTVTLLQKTTESDPCDPCADTVDVESQVGNYLFRVEVHDVKGDANDPSELTLKWSSENAAEQYALKNAIGDDVEPPAEFKNGQWAYEFFDETSEKHLGVHLAPGFTPSRDELTTKYPTATPSRNFVRRWDGYCKLKKSGNWEVTEQFDQNQPESVLFTNIADGKLTVNLDAQALILTLNSSFVAGDYWLGEVREAEHEAGSELIAQEPPHGIAHHYLTLGKVEGGVLQPNPEADRKYAFPSLTEMTRMFMAGGDGQEVMPGQPLPQPLRVGVANGEWPVEEATVRFQIEEGGGSLSRVNGGKTNADGIAECAWTPGIAMNADFQVKATLVDPDDPAQDLDHPPVYFYANLITADQVAYAPGCPDSGENAVHSLLAEDATVSLDLGLDGYYTVKEVLDALLCKLAAKHVPYDPVPKDSRWADINDGPERPGTVQQAIDDLAENLESTDIRYQVPNCGTPASPTVRSSLSISAGTHKIDKILDKLLCDLKATNLPIDRSADLCDTLKNDAQVKTVQDAINAVCRMERGRGCKVTVGKGGQFTTIEKAVQALIGEGIFDICICLLRGDHPLQGKIAKEKDFPHLNLSVTGCGPGTRVQLTDSVEFIEIGDLHLEHLRIENLDKEHPVGISNCGEVTLNVVHHLGRAPDKALLTVNGTSQFSMNHCVMEAYQELKLEVPMEVFAFAPDLASLFARPGREAFLEVAAIDAEKLAQMDKNDRQKMAEELQAALKQVGEKISPNELLSYQQLLRVLPLQNTGKVQFMDVLRGIRDQAHHAVAGCGLIFNDALAQVSILNSRIYGQVCLYGPPGDVLKEEEIKQLGDMLKEQGQLTLIPQATDFFMQGTQLTRLALSAKRVDEIRQIIKNKKGTLTDLYEAAQIANSVFAINGNQLLFGETTLSGNNMESLHPVVGNVIGETAIYTGNRVYRKLLLGNTSPVGGGRMLTAAREVERAANMPRSSW